MPAQGGEAIQLTRNGGAASFESPDGAYLYFAKRTPDGGPPSIWRMPLRGGEEERVLEKVGSGDWTLTDRGVYYVNREAQPGPTIELFDFATGEVSPVAVLEIPLPFLISVSPDEQRILYVRFDKVESDIMLVENFR